MALDGGLTGTLWSDSITLTDPAAAVLAHYRSGDFAGLPAVTRRRTAAGPSCVQVLRPDHWDRPDPLAVLT